MFPIRCASIVLLALALCVAARPAPGATLIYGYDASDDHLLSFYSDAPGSIVDDVPLTGLAATEVLAGIDVRPLDGLLYAIAIDGAMGRVVTIDPQSGAVTSVGSVFAAPVGSHFGVDVNPVANRIRLVDDADVNQRFDPDTGALAATDGFLTYAAGDVGESSNPFVVHTAYTNSFVGASTTTLYGIDTGLDSLVIQNPPNAGILTTVGALGVNAGPTGGFDIEPGTNAAFAALRIGSSSQLYTVDLGTGTATLVGTIGGGGTIDGIAIAPEPGAIASALAAVVMLGWLRRRAPR